MKIPSGKKLLSYFILFSFACGPGPLDFTEYFTIFYPEAAENPVATQPYFYTNDYLNNQYFMISSASLADSLNIESWYNYTEKKLKKEEIKTGLYDKVSGFSLAEKLRKIDKTEAADYVIFAQEIDKETQKFSTYWEPAEEVNEQLLADLRDLVLLKSASSHEDFIKERYAFQALKIDAKIGAWDILIKDYHELNKAVKNKTYISEWSQSRYAGALLYQSDTAAAILEFAKVFENSPTRRNQADLSVRHLSNPNFGDALTRCKTDKEKLAVYSLQAIQPFQDGLDLLKKIAEIDPNYPMLELVMAREINKNEVNFYAEKNAGLYAPNLDVFDEDYNLDSSKIAKVKAEGLSYFETLLDFNESFLKNENLSSKAFWFTTAAYLNFIKEDYSKMKTFLAKASDQKPESSSLKNQIRLFNALLFLETESIDSSELDLLNQISAFRKVENFRDNNVLVLLADKLSAKYLDQNQSETETGGWLSSCSKKKIKSEDKNLNEVKSFVAKHIAASKEDYSYMNGFSESGLLRGADLKLLKTTIDYLNTTNLSEEDKKLIELAELNKNELLMAYGRKLVRTQQYELALATFKQCEDSHFPEGQFEEYFSPIPDQFIADKTIVQGRLAPLDYLEQVVISQKETAINPNNAQAWYDLGLTAYNMSYWGNGWLFSDREWSSMEIEYGDPTSEDYYTNFYAKDCFEKALAANPDSELGAKICYMGALCERNQYFIAFTNGKPNTFNETELDYYRIKMETSVKPTFQSFFKRLKNKYDETVYESQVIKECMSYVDFKLK